MKFVAISDTHGQHNYLTLPKGDVLIHAGDMAMKGTRPEVEDFLNWFASLHFPHKILIAGNHDFFFERAPQDDIDGIIPAGVTYLNDSAVTINNITIWGSPITPWFFNWAFNRHRGDDIAKHWNLIPQQTDIIITHGPVANILDATTSGHNAGCADLLQKINEIQPKVHICGHIHEAYGVVEKQGTTFINASALNEKYQLVNKPVVFEL